MSEVVSALLIALVSISYRYEYNNLEFPLRGSYNGRLAFRKGPSCHKNMICMNKKAKGRSRSSMCD